MTKALRRILIGPDRGDDRVGVRRNAAALIGERTLLVVLSGAIGLAIARHLGADQYGRFSVALALVTLFFPFTDLGQGVIVREVVSSPQLVGGLYRAVMRWMVAISTVAAVAALASAPLVIGDEITDYRVVAILAGQLLVRPLHVVDYFLQGSHRAHLGARARSMAAIVGAVARLILIASGGGIIALSLVVTFEALLGGVLLVVAFSATRGTSASGSLSRDSARRLVRESVPIIITTSAIAIYMRIDQLMLGHLSSEREVGIYAAAVRLSEIPYAMPAAIAMAMGPQIADAFQRDRVRYEHLVQRMFAVLAGLSVLTIAAIAIGAPLASRVLGSSYEGITPVLRLHSLSLLAVSLGVGQSLLTINERSYGPAMVRTLVGAAVNISLNFVLLPRYGAIGAAGATVVSYVLAAVVMNGLMPTTRHVFRWQLGSLDPRSTVPVLSSEARRLRPRTRSAK